MYTYSKHLTTYIVPVIALLMAAMLLAAPLAASAAPMLSPFTQTELDDNWEADRFFPTDDVTSVTAFGRDDVARIGIDSSNTQSGTFQRTEGIKTVGVQDFGTAAQVDLYLDPDWEDKAVRSGFWLSGINDVGERAPEFVIIEFVNLEPSDSGDSAEGDHTGWRAWISGTGWFNLETPYEYGNWYTLAMELDTDAQEYTYSIDGEEVATQAAGGETEYVGELFLNSYNYGLDEFPNLSNDSYTAHWHVGEEFEPTLEITAPE